MPVKIESVNGQRHCPGRTWEGGSGHWASELEFYTYTKKIQDGSVQTYFRARCKECAKARKRWLYAQDPEKYRETFRRWKQANPEKHRANQRRWFRRNVGKGQYVWSKYDDEASQLVRQKEGDTKLPAQPFAVWLRSAMQVRGMTAMDLQKMGLIDSSNASRIFRCQQQYVYLSVVDRVGVGLGWPDLIPRLYPQGEGA